MMYIRVRFFFTRLECRNISVLLIEIVDPTGSSPRPRSQCFFFNAFTASFIGFSQIELQAFSSRISYCCYGMIGIHTTGVTCNFREGRHPHITHLFSHAQIRVNHILFRIFVNQEAQGMSCTISIPNPVVRIERFAIILVYFTVERTEITTALTDANWTFEYAIK